MTWNQTEMENKNQTKLEKDKLSKTILNFFKIKTVKQR